MNGVRYDPTGRDRVGAMILRSLGALFPVAGRSGPWQPAPPNPMPNALSSLRGVVNQMPQGTQPPSRHAALGALPGLGPYWNPAVNARRGSYS